METEALKFLKLSYRLYTDLNWIKISAYGVTKNDRATLHLFGNVRGKHKMKGIDSVDDIKLFVLRIYLDKGVCQTNES